jgi:hypothetical protein
MTTLLKVAQAGYNNKVFFKNVPYYTQFSPTSIANCALWLDGADASTITTATGVSQWNDKSGNGFNLTQSTGSLQPTRTGNYLNFQSNYFLNIPTSAINNTSAYSFFFVFNPIASLNWILQKQYNGVGSYDMISMTNYWQTSTGSTSYLYWTAWANPGPFANSGSALSLSTVQLIEITFDGTTLTMYRNGNVLSTSVGSYTIPNATSVTNCTLGSWIADGSIQNNNTTNFQLGEFVYYNTFLSTTQRQKIESYLAQKWGLVSSLPAGHLNTTFPAGSPEIVKNYISQVQINVTNILFFISIMSTVYSLSTYSLAAIANSVSAASGTVSYIWTVAVPSGAKGKNAILVIFFNLYSLTQFQASQYFDYGIYVDGVIQGFGDTGTARYIHTAAGNYALNNGGITYGTNAMSPYQPLIIPLVLASGATTIQLGIKNSQSALTPLASTQIGYLTNNTSSTGTINTSGYSPQTLFTTAGSNVYTVPTTCSAGTVTGVFVYLWGSGGQGTNNGATRYCVGGAGGFVSGYYACAGGTNLIYVVGSPAGTGAAATGGGGAGGGNTGGQGYDGGGFTGLFLSNAGGIAQSNVIAIAGGGGGGGLGGNCVGGYGGYPTGGAPTQYGTGTVATAILGGSQTAGGIGDRNAGSALLGASSSGGSDGGGAGGGGWYGGGSHGGSQWVSGTGGYFGGAGGSSYVGSTLGATPSPAGIGLTSSAVTSNGNTSATYTPSVPGGVSSTYYPASGTYGYGDVTSLRTGGGCIAIVPAVGANPVNVGVSAKLYSV